MIFIVGCVEDIPLNDRPVKENLKELKVFFVDVGQADCSIIILPTKEVIMIDAGLDHATIYDSTINYPSWNNIHQVLEAENITTINYFILTHMHADHYYFATKIMNEYIVNTVVLSGTTSTTTAYYNILNTIENKNIDCQIVSVGEKIIVRDQILMQVIATKKEDNPDNLNYCSVATKLTYNNIAFVFTGDIGYNKDDGEEIALNSGIDLKANVLKVPHHGSTYSSGRDFLRAVNPDYAILTTSNYTTTGHPHKKALDRLSYYCENILQTKDQGTILFRTNGIELNCESHYGI